MNARLSSAASALALAMLIALASCGGSGDSPSDGPLDAAADARDGSDGPINEGVAGPDADAGPSEGCVKTSCQAQKKNCGMIPDDCGGTLDCGGCLDGETCGGGGTKNVCAPMVDPNAFAPPLDRTVATNVFDSTQFLYTGANAAQTGADAKALDPARVSLVRGKVLDAQGAPLKDVAVSVVGHSEYGKTLTRQSGEYDLVVNGGGQLTFDYQKSGLLPLHRRRVVAAQRYVTIDDAVMRAVDSKVTSITSGSSAAQLVRGSAVTDSDGTRTGTLIIASGTTAQMRLPSGLQPLPQLAVRITEYTAGQRGPAAMPASLPGTSGYTYAVELTVDQAVAAGASRVEFNQPVIYAVENFLGFAVGTRVPLGFYERDKRAWVAANNGRVIKILGIAQGRAELDLDGNGNPASPAELAVAGISDEERTQLAGIYSAGQQIWRVPITHFSTPDCNWAVVPPPGARGPGGRARGEHGEDDPCNDDGSVIECQNQVLGERIALVGVPFTLNYRSDRAPGRLAAYKLTIPLTDAAPPAPLQRVDLTIDVAGQRHRRTFLSPSANRSDTFTWDGKDAYGRLVQGQQQAHIDINYVYNGVYAEPQDVQRAFGEFGIGNLTLGPSRQQVGIGDRHVRTVGALDAKDVFGLAGWSLSVHHYYSPISRTLFLGDGTRRRVDNLQRTTRATVNALFGQGFNGDNQPAVLAQLRFPGGIARDSAGNLYIADGGNHRVRRVDSAGVITTIAGTGTRGFSGDGGQAAQAQLDDPGDIEVDRDGNIFFIDRGNRRVRRVDAQGVITTVAGNGQVGYNGDGVAATSAQLDAPNGIALDARGNLYIADTNNARVRKVSAADGLIQTIAGDGQGGSPIGDGDLATKAHVIVPQDVVVDGEGAVYIAQGGNVVGGGRVRKIGTDGIINTVVGSGWATVDSGAYGPALQAKLRGPRAIALSPTGRLYLASDFNVFALSSDGLLIPYAGGGKSNALADGLPATASDLKQIVDLDFDISGRLVLLDRGQNAVRIVERAFARYSGAPISVPSADGTLLYRFAPDGRHLSTVHSLTGAALYRFAYDGSGRLITVTDADGNVTTVERDISGRPSAITGPYGQRTVLALHQSGYLASVEDPAQQKTAMAYNAGGLLTELTDAAGNKATFSYDSDGRLIKDQHAAGGVTTLTRSETAQGFKVVSVNGAGQQTEFELTFLAGERKSRIAKLGSGQNNSEDHDDDGSSTVKIAEGTTLQRTVGPDPRFGMQVPLRAQSVIDTPGGRKVTADHTRDATLSDPTDPLSVTKVTERWTVNGRQYRSIYTASNKTFVDTTPAGLTYRTTLDSAGRMLSQSFPGHGTIEQQYDARGRLAKVTSSDGSTSRSYALTYDALGRLATVTDPMNHASSYTYDAANRVTRADLPGNRRVDFVFDANGRVTSLTPPGRPAHLLTRDKSGRIERYTAPAVGGSSSVTRFSYDGGGRLTTITRADGKVITIGRDSVKRLGTLTIPRGSYAFGYDSSTGTPRSMSSPDNVTLTLSYDGLLLTSEQYGGALSGTVSTTYDNDRRVATRSVNGTSPIAFTYQQERLSGAGAMTIQYASGTQLVSRTQLGSVTVTRSYDGFGYLKTLVAKAGSTTLYDASYTRDALERLSELREQTFGATTPTTFKFVYDAARQLTSVSADQTPLAQLAYDSNRNRTSIQTAQGTTNSSYDDQDRLTKRGSVSYSYNAAGELTERDDGGSKTRYSFDALGNLIGVTLPDSTAISYLYDARQRRVGKRVGSTLTRGYLYLDNLNPVAELDGSGAVVARFVYATQPHVPDYMIKGGVTYMLVYDELGSIRVVVNSQSGQVVQKIDYSAFGEVLQDSNPGFQPFGFAGGLYDPQTKLVHYGARDYDPQIGRFISKDPLLFRSGTTNLYAYANNDPVNRIDPAGLSPGAGGGPPWTVGDVISGSPPAGLSPADREAFVELSQVYRRALDAERIQDGLSLIDPYKCGLTASIVYGQIKPNDLRHWTVAKWRWPGWRWSGGTNGALGAHSAVVLKRKGDCWENGIIIDVWWLTRATSSGLAPKSDRPGGFAYCSAETPGAWF